MSSFQTERNIAMKKKKAVPSDARNSIDASSAPSCLFSLLSNAGQFLVLSSCFCLSKRIDSQAASCFFRRRLQTSPPPPPLEGVPPGCLQLGSQERVMSKNRFSFRIGMGGKDKKPRRSVERRRKEGVKEKQREREHV